MLDRRPNEAMKKEKRGKPGREVEERTQRRNEARVK